MGQYDKKGVYAGYDKNHKERDKLDYYSTPTSEVVNILDVMGIPFRDTDTILEPCCGGGHMIEGIARHLNERDIDAQILGTDIQKREIVADTFNAEIHMGKEYDFIEDAYPYTNSIDYIIINPPFTLIEPFVMKSLELAQEGVLMFGRLQFLEGEKRYEHILKDNPPTLVEVYVDRIACYKNGDTTVKPDAIQAYAWFWWNKKTEKRPPRINWIRRADKNKA